MCTGTVYVQISYRRDRRGRRLEEQVHVAREDGKIVLRSEQLSRMMVVLLLDQSRVGCGPS